jgi:hypothetical protein
VLAALPPPCQPPQEALAAARAQLLQLPAGGAGEASRTLHMGTMYCGCCRRCRVRVHWRPGCAQRAEQPVAITSVLLAIQALHAVRQLCTVWRDAD